MKSRRAQLLDMATQLLVMTEAIQINVGRINVTAEGIQERLATVCAEALAEEDEPKRRRRRPPVARKAPAPDKAVTLAGTEENS